MMSIIASQPAAFSATLCCHVLHSNRGNRVEHGRCWRRCCWLWWRNRGTTGATPCRCHHVRRRSDMLSQGGSIVETVSSPFWSSVAFLPWLPFLVVPCYRSYLSGCACLPSMPARCLPGFSLRWLSPGLPVVHICSARTHNCNCSSTSCTWREVRLLYRLETSKFQILLPAPDLAWLYSCCCCCCYSAFSDRPRKASSPSSSSPRTVCENYDLSKSTVCA